MRAILALIRDTWHQTRRQPVFIVFALLLTLLVGGISAMAHVEQDGDGERRLKLALLGVGQSDMASGWEHFHLEVRAGHLSADETREAMRGRSVETVPAQWPDESDEAFEIRLAEFDAKKEAEEEALRERENRVFLLEEEARERAAELPEFKRAVEVFSYFIVRYVIVLFGLIGFISFASGMFPEMLRSGAPDMVLSKPVSRLNIMLGRYLGGLVVFGGLLLWLLVLMVAVIGLRTGHWPMGVLAAWLPTLGVAALLFGVLSLLGIVTRSSVMTLLIGFVYYVLIDMLMGFLPNIIALFVSMGQDGDHWLISTAELIRDVTPNFTLLNTLAAGHVLTTPGVPWQPLFVGACWMVASLGLGYLSFRRKDF